MKNNLESGILTIYLDGRIDSSNANEIENDIFNIINSKEHEQLILDIDGLEYISSAGLRIILKIKKAEQNVQIINANTDVYEIFDMTGFAEMMDIKKAYKKYSIDGCEEIGHGANGIVYRIDKDTIIKVYKNPDSLDDIKNERALAKKAFVAGIPTAISYDIARVGDKYGTVFELLNAKSIAKLLLEKPEDLDKYVDMYVDLLKKIHATKDEAGDMVDMRQVALTWAKFDQDYLPKEIGEKLYELVKAVPVDNHMLHGDYHIKNVMVQDGEALLIDMDTLCVGNPIFELGSMFNAYKGFSALDASVSEAFLGITHEIGVEFWEKALKKYLGTSNEARLKEVEEKASIVGYMRLLRRLIRRGGGDAELSHDNIDHYIKELTRLVPKYDTLLI